MKNTQTTQDEQDVLKMGNLITPTEIATVNATLEKRDTDAEFEALWNGVMTPNLRKCAFFVYWYEVVKQAFFTAYCAGKAARTP